MKKNDNFDFIKDKFEKENITAPESLDSRIEKGLHGGEEKIIPLKSVNKKSHRGLKRFAAVAACVAVAVTSFAVGNAYSTYPRVSNTPTPRAVTYNGEELQGLTYFKSYDEIETLFKEIDKRNNYTTTMYGTVRNFGFVVKSSAVAEDAEMSVTADAAPTATVGASHAETNKQVDAVDEADMIKTDSSHIYYIPNTVDRLIIYSAVDGKTEKLSQIKPDKNEYFNEMFLADDKLVVIGNHSYYNYYYNDVIDYAEDAESDEKDNDDVDEENYAFVKTYDISDIKNPKLKSEYKQSGSYSSSRLLNGVVYLVTNDGYYYGYKGCIPCATGDDGEYKKIAVEDICGISNTDCKSYAVIGAVDINTGKNKSATKAVLGISEDIYCSENNLYLAGTVNEWGKKRTVAGEVYDEIISENTQIIKYSLDGLKIKEVASGTVKGRINNQFSMDEYDGNFRIATTSYAWYSSMEKDTNNLFVLDSELKELGSVTGFAKNEHIEAVRFMGDTAYVITYVQIDPLFVIDLSDPKNPEIKGEVEIEGFSSQLTPIDENTLLGIGYATADNGYGGEMSDGLKIVIFDVSDKTKPRVAAQKSIPDSWSVAQENHKAIVKNSEAGYFAIPFEMYDDTKSDYGSGALLIVPENNQLKIKNFKTGKDAERVTYIGNYLYVFGGEVGIIDSFELQ